MKKVAIAHSDEQAGYVHVVARDITIYRHFLQFIIPRVPVVEDFTYYMRVYLPSPLLVTGDGNTPLSIVTAMLDEYNTTAIAYDYSFENYQRTPR